MVEMAVTGHTIREVRNMLEKQPKANTETKISKKDFKQNQEHNVKKEALGPNTRQN